MPELTDEEIRADKARINQRSKNIELLQDFSAQIKNIRISFDLLRGTIQRLRKLQADSLFDDTDLEDSQWSRNDIDNFTEALQQLGLTDAWLSGELLATLGIPENTLPAPLVAILKTNRYGVVDRWY